MPKEKRIEKQTKVYEREEEEAKRLLTQAGGIAAFNSTVSESLTEDLLRFKGIEATLELSKSPNSKVVVIGSGQGGMPLILNPDGTPTPAPAPAR